MCETRYRCAHRNLKTAMFVAVILVIAGLFAGPSALAQKRSFGSSFKGQTSTPFNIGQALQQSTNRPAYNSPSRSQLPNQVQSLISSQISGQRLPTLPPGKRPSHGSSSTHVPDRPTHPSWPPKNNGHGNNGNGNHGNGNHGNGNHGNGNHNNGNHNDHNHNIRWPHLPVYPRPNWNPVPVTPVYPRVPSWTPLPVNPQPVNPQPVFVPSNPLPVTVEAPVAVVPENALPPLPRPAPRLPENVAPSAQLQSADKALTQAVHADVERLFDARLDRLRNKLATHDRQLARQLDVLAERIAAGDSLRDVVTSARELRDAIKALNVNAEHLVGGDSAKDLVSQFEQSILLAAVNQSIANAVADGKLSLPKTDTAPIGPGDLLPNPDGGGPGPGPGPGPVGPDGFADVPDAPLPPAGGGDGGAPGGGGFSLDLDFDLWFHGASCPIVCYPDYPAGSCCWISDEILICGTGGVGVVQVCYGSPAYVGLPLPTVDPVSDAPEGLDDLGRILLLNPETNNGTVQYLVDGQPFTMEAGMMQDLPFSKTLIQFDRGAEFGKAKYTLTPGTFRFVVTDKGWELVRTEFAATLDNTASAVPFQLKLDGETIEVPARSQQEIKSPYPLLVEFDDGADEEPAKKQLAKEKIYTIGINRVTGEWDMFAGDAEETGAGQADDYQVIASADDIQRDIAAPQSIDRVVFE